MAADILRVVSVSGGKDSTCLYIWAIRTFGRDGFVAVFADTGHEHPVTLNYLRNMPQMCGGPEINWVSADFTQFAEDKGIEPSGNQFLDLCLIKGRVPSTKAQFCTENLKLAPIKEWCERRAKGRKVVHFVGIRAGESRKRSKLGKAELSAYHGAWMVRPLLRWTEEQVFAYLREADVAPNPLYEAGFERVGCFPCIHARKSELARLPDWAWDKLAAWEKRIGRTWFPFGTVPLTDEQKAMIEEASRAHPPVKNKSGEDVDSQEVRDLKGRLSPLVADVRPWASTVRGGQQFDLFAPDTADVPHCVSTWGTCE